MITDDDGRDSTVPPAPPPAAGGRESDTVAARDRHCGTHVGTRVQVQVLQMGTII